MFLWDLFAALGMMVVFSSILLGLFRRRKWGLLLLIPAYLFLAAWAGSAWAGLVGALRFGMYWLPFLLAGLGVALIFTVRAGPLRIQAGLMFQDKTSKRTASHLAPAWACALWFCLTAVSAAGESADEEVPAKVNLEQVQARISPNFELVIPYGNLEVLFQERFGRLDSSFSVGYQFLSNSVGASLSLSRPFRVLTPGVRMHTQVDFENYLHPQIRDGDFTLVPTDKYISRKRGMDLRLDIKLGSRTHATTAFLVSDVFRGDLSESVVLTKGTDLVFRSSLAYEGIILHENRGGPFPSGTHASSSLDLGFRDSFSDPVSLDHHGNLLLYQSLGRRLGTRVNLSISYPLKIWRKDLTSFYRLGGYRDIRGYPPGELGAFRYALLTSDVHYRFVDLSAALPEVADRKLRLSRVSPYALMDLLLYQDSLGLDSPGKARMSLGGGVSVNLVEGDKRHYTIRLSLAQPLERGYGPSLYLTLASSPFKTLESGETVTVE